MSRQTLRTCAALTLLAATAAQASDINAVNLLNQAEFRALSEDLGATLAYKALVPAESLGIIGFDLGVAATGTSMESRAVLSKAAGGASMPRRCRW